MKFIKNTLFVWLLCLSILGISQDFQQDYLFAKNFFNEGKYKLAQEAFKPLIPKNENNPFSAYASFYYAVSAYREGFPALAKDMFLQVKQVYSKWSRIDEVNYWLGQIYFEKKAYDLAVDVLRDIKSKTIKADVSALKKHYFSQISDNDLLIELYQTYPAERELAGALATSISKQPLVNQDHDLMKEIIDRFQLTPEDFNVITIEKPVFKKEYKIAMLYPFMVKDLEPDERKKFNQFVLDIYQGVELAVDSLRGKGVSLKLYTYDTRRDEKVTQMILEKDELKGMDLIIGPFSSRLTAMVNQFSFTHRINVINPLRTDSDVIGNNPYAFLYNPSNETIGRRMGDYVIKNMDRKPGIIFYGESKSDSILAHAYKERVEKDSFNIIITKRIKKDATREILDILLVSDKKLSAASSEEAKERYRIPPDSISHIFVASTNDLISSKVISAVETRGDSVKVMGPADWLELSLIDYDAYRRLNVMLYAPVYKVKDSEMYDAFRQAYVRKHKVAPNKYVEIGYDLMMLVGNALDKYGKYFQIGWNKEELLEGSLTVGHRFKNSNDNHIVPLLTFEDEGVKISYEIEDDKYAFQKQ
ncbi:ABC transporter substrate-binding protein [Fulvivirga sp. M361]|uniref:ABC transporter substrate-binding protein n=1 Tax=Fulvivirga sp. M361 TaxID=2594266 RepID=UPI00117A375E|nr:tetratricopeptide repeat protein [Fulvivirga sp. M361]TRX55979.1 ABC transporter substrate-binding protein [Fulvivirga sp. M361]